MNNVFTYSLATYDNGGIVPSFMNMDSSRMLRVNTNDINDAGTYEIILNATLDDPVGSYNDSVRIMI